MPVELTENQIWLAERQPTGFLVALWLDSTVAEKLVVPGGESAESLHVTLCYCGEASEIDELDQIRAMAAIDEVVRYQTPLEGKIAGYGRFIASESSEGQDVFYATPDIPRLAELRQCIVNCLSETGVYPSTSHGYTPHITLSYLKPAASNPVQEVEALPLLFSGVTVMSGTRRIDIPFWEADMETVSMSDTIDELPIAAPLGTQPARALYFGSFDKEWIPFLPKPGSYEHDGYGTMDLSADVYTQMLQNFNANVYKQDLPIRATHTPETAGAVGWIKPGGMRLASDGSLEVKPEWNALGRGLVDDDRFRYVSAEFCREWTDPVTQEKVQNLAVGLALVTRPHFKTDVLNPLSASEALAFAEATAEREKIAGVADGGEIALTINYNESGAAGEGTQMSEEEIKAAAEAKLAEEAKVAEAAKLAETKPAEFVAPAVSLNDLTQVVITAEQRKNERQMFADLTSRVELAERRASTAEAELKRIAKESLTNKFTAEVLGRSAENGQAWFGPPKENVDQLVSLAETYGEASQEVKWTISQKRNEAKAIHATGLFDPISIGLAESGNSVAAQVQQLAEQYRLADPALTMEKAITKAYDEHPDLYIKSLKR